MIPLRCKAWLLLIGGCLLLNGCVAPYYTNHQLILFGKATPTITGLDVPAIQRNLSTIPAPKVNRITMLTDFSTIPLKCLGIQGWKDFHLNAEARGTVVQHQLSSDRILTVDLRLISLEINGTPIPMSNGRFIRCEIYRGKVRVDKRVLARTNAVMVVKGKLVWDTDGWFEIHPQGRGDVRFDSTPDSPHAEVDALKRLQAESGQCPQPTLDTLLPAILQSPLGFDPTGDRAFKGEL